MNRYIKLGYEGIELELPVHSLYLYRESTQLLENIIPLISEGVERKERCFFGGREVDCKFLRNRFKKNLTLVSKGVEAADFIPWIKSEYDKLPSTYHGLRVFLESTPEFLGYEDILDDFNTQPDLRLFLLCQYQIDSLNSEQMLNMLKNHPYVFVEHLLKPNCFYSRVKHRIWLCSFNRHFYS